MCLSRATRGLLRLPHSRPPRSSRPRVTHERLRSQSQCEGERRAEGHIVCSYAAMAWTRAAAVEIAASQGFSRRRASGWRGRVRSVESSIKRQWMHIRDACMHETRSRHRSIAWQSGQDDYSYRWRGDRELEGRRCTTSWSRECGTWVSAATCPWRQRGSPRGPPLEPRAGPAVRRSSGEARIRRGARSP